MAGNYFRFKQFTVFQEKSVFKVGTDGVLLGAYADISGSKTILEVGTGTGMISMMLAQRSGAGITALEPDPDSYNLACLNVEKSKWRDRIKVVNCDLQGYSPGDHRFDLMISNPPYFVDSLRNPDALKAQTRHNVLLDHSDILEGAEKLLRENGRLQLILPWVEGNVFIAEAQGSGFYCNDILKIKAVPSGGIKRIIVCFSRKRTRVTEKFLTIEKSGRHDYTEDYINLTRDFYLKF